MIMIALLSVRSRPLYMTDDGNVFPVQAGEYGLGYHAVRFEIKF